MIKGPLEFYLFVTGISLLFSTLDDFDIFEFHENIWTVVDPFERHFKRHICIERANIRTKLSDIIFLFWIGSENYL